MIVMTFYPFKNNSIKKADIVTNRKLDFVEDRVGRGLAGSQAAVALQLGIKIGDHVEDGVKNGTCADSAESVSSRESVPFPPNHVKEPIDSNESHQSDEQLDELNYDFHLYLHPIFHFIFLTVSTVAPLPQAGFCFDGRRLGMARRALRVA